MLDAKFNLDQSLSVSQNLIVPGPANRFASEDFVPTQAEMARLSSFRNHHDAGFKFKNFESAKIKQQQLAQLSRTNRLVSPRTRGHPKKCPNLRKLRFGTEKC